MPPNESPDVKPSRRAEGLIGTILLFAGFLLLALTLVDKSGAFDLPAVWTSNRTIWQFLIFASIITAIALLRKPVVPGDWAPEQPGPRFGRLVLYTRVNCHLCDQAKDTLLNYSQWLPGVEEIDIDQFPNLHQQFDTCVPVVEIDGKVRFRGQVNEILLQRLINATPPWGDAPAKPANSRPRSISRTGEICPTDRS